MDVFLSLTLCIRHSSTSSAGDVASLQSTSFPKEDGTVTDREPKDGQLSSVCAGWRILLLENPFPASVAVSNNMP